MSFLSALCLLNQWVDFDQMLVDRYIGMEQSFDYILVTLILFSRSRRRVFQMTKM